MSFLDTFSAALPHGIRLEDLKILVPSQWWHDKPEQAAVSALCRCGKFDTQDYLERYPDVAQKGLDPVLHFVQHGIAEKRHFKCLPNVNFGESRVRLAHQYFQKGEHEKALQVYEELSEQMGEKNFVANIAICKKKLGSKKSLTALAKEISQPKPKVSVLIPVYNNAQYLHECIDSVINQTLKEIEIIIINDGSTDPEAVRILNDYAAKDNRIKLIHKQNTGYGHSMNVGLDNATGEYIGIVESDDYVLPEMYQTYYKIVRENKLDFIKSDAKIFYGNKEERFFEERIICSDDSKYDIFLDPWRDIEVFNIHNVIWNALYDRKFIIINKIRFNETPGASYQDNGFWFQTLIYTHKFMIVHKPLYMLRRDNAASSFFNKEKIFCMCDEYKYIYNILSKSKKQYHKFIKIYQLKKYQNSIFTLKKIDKKYRKKFLSRLADEFKDALHKKEIDKDIFKDKYNSIIKIISGTYSCEWMETPEVSLIIPIYNSEKYLEQCLNSIKNQTFKNIEIICIDDGSTDMSYKILRAFLSNDKRFKVFKQNNTGAGAARNVGLTHAIGDYVMFLDSDDFFEEKMIELMLKKIKMYNADFCVCKSKRFLNNEYKNLDFAVKKNCIPLETDTFSASELEGNIFKVFCGWAWDKMYAREFILKNNIKFQEIESTNDLLFTFSALIKAKKICICDEYLVNQRENFSGSISTTLRAKNPLNFIYALRELKSILLKENLYEKFYKSFISYAVHAYLWNFYTLKGKECVQLYNKKNDFIKEFEIDKFFKNDFFDSHEYETLIKL